MTKRILLFVTLLVCSMVLLAEEPVLRIGCMSDIHNQNSMISNDIDKIRIRTSFKTTLDSMKREGADMLILGGDYTSDCTISQEQWMRVRDLMVEATRNVFEDTATFRPVLYLTGNHDYEVANFDALPKKWLASDFYAYPMVSDIGFMDDDDMYYEFADNGSEQSMKVLGAYHYVIYGIDFVVMNPGKYFFASAWDYQVSSGTVDWLSKKLEQIYKDDPSKTVFFLHHLPLPNSVGVQSGKTLKDITVTQNLIKVLAKYPNLIYIYGHDHSTRNSFITEDIRQRVTEYDSQGNVITQAADPITADSVNYAGRAVYVQNTFTSNPYLCGGSSSSYLGAGSQPTCFVLSDAGEGLYNLRLNSTGYYVTCNGTYKLGSSNSAAAKLKLYRLTASSTSAKPWVTGVRVTKPAESLDFHEKYIIVGNSSKDYVLSNENKSGELGSSSSITYPNDSTFTYTSSSGFYNGPSSTTGIIWSFIDTTPDSTETGGGQTPQTVTPSFVSSFMGSMRYNSLDSNSSPGTSDSPIIQALMIYIYPDSIELKMKNYGKTGALSGNSITTNISKDLKSYVIHRHVNVEKQHNEDTIPPISGIQKTSQDFVKGYFSGQHLVVSNVVKGSNVNLYDAVGRLVYSTKATDVVIDCPLNFLCAGMYYLSVSNATNIANLKLTYKGW